MLKKKFNSVNRTENIFKKGSIRWVIFEKKRFDSLSRMQNLESFWKKRGQSIVRVMFNKKFNSLSHVQQKVQIVESCKKEGFNSVSHLEKMIQFCESCFFFLKESLILWVIKKVSLFWLIFFRKSILRVIISREFWFFETYL